MAYENLKGKIVWVIYQPGDEGSYVGKLDQINLSTIVLKPYLLKTEAPSLNKDLEKVLANMDQEKAKKSLELETKKFIGLREAR